MYIETPRMIIRDFTPEDAADLHDIFGDDETMENCEPAYDFEKTKEFLTSFCIDRKGAVAAVHKESGKMTGYRHREDEMVYYAKKNYIRVKSQSTILAKDIRIFGLQNWLNDLLNNVHDLYLDFSLKVERKWLIADMTEAVLTMARNGIAYVYLIHMTLNEGLSVSEFLLYFTAVSTFTTWVMGILRDVSRLHKDSLDISTVREYLEYPEPFKFEDGEPVPKAASYELKLEHVSFRYPGAEQDTIHDLNLVVRPGEKLAIVGLNGAGKTTLVKLLCGLFDPTEGRVLLNGKDVRDFNRSAYYDLFSAVFQEFSLMDVTIAENVAQTTVDIDYERVRNCIEKAGLTKSINELPKGLDTHVGRNVFLDGVLFSGGQTQRLMLARALYKDGPILILDEPTAALDPIAENDIYMKYNDMTFGKTSVFISHRLASTRFCDRIIFVADGNIAEEGTHQGSLTTEKRSDRQYEVEFRDVSFKYPGSEIWALRHVNMKFKVGKRLAIVGENGSGKTTFIKLLCRLYDPQEGQILLNGIDIRKYRYDDYMNIFSVVFQDFQFICQPLGENVAGSMEYDRDRVKKALVDAGFGDRLESMEKGLDTMLYKDLSEDGVDVSGGEAQKIAIARALYKDAPFIILDEPTAALDPIAEAEIYAKFNDISGDKTAIYISHRLSSCKFCDEIAVFHDGAVIQQGSHDELLSDENGKYHELWNAQAQYYTE